MPDRLFPAPINRAADARQTNARHRVYSPRSWPCSSRTNFLIRCFLLSSIRFEYVIVNHVRLCDRVITYFSTGTAGGKLLADGRADPRVRARPPGHALASQGAGR